MAVQKEKTRKNMTKKEVLDLKRAYLNLNKYLEEERKREDVSQVLLTEFERIAAELKDKIFTDCMGG